NFLGSHDGLFPVVGRSGLLDSAFAHNEAAAEGEFGIGEAKGFLGDGEGDTGEFEENGAGLDLGDVVFNAALTGAHSDFSGLLGYGLVREHANPEFALALEVARDGDAGGFDLAAGHGTAREGLQAEFTEGERVATLG